MYAIYPHISSPSILSCLSKFKFTLNGTSANKPTSFLSTTLHYALKSKFSSEISDNI